MTKITVMLEARDSKPDTILAAVQRCWTAFCAEKLRCDAVSKDGRTVYTLKDLAGNRVRITTEAGNDKGC